MSIHTLSSKPPDKHRIPDTHVRPRHRSAPRALGPPQGPPPQAGDLEISEPIIEGNGALEGLFGLLGVAIFRQRVSLKVAMFAAGIMLTLGMRSTLQRHPSSTVDFVLSAGSCSKHQA